MDYLFTCPELAHLCEESNVRGECPFTCGVCTADPNECRDRNPDCPTFSLLCIKYTKQCPKTCGTCTSNSTVTQTTTVVPMKKSTTTVPLSTKSRATVPVTTEAFTTELKTTVPLTILPTTTKTTKKALPTTPKPPCKDSSPNCPTWAKNGFCTNTFYPPEKRKEYCAKTCKFC